YSPGASTAPALAGTPALAPTSSTTSTRSSAAFRAATKSPSAPVAPTAASKAARSTPGVQPEQRHAGVLAGVDPHRDVAGRHLGGKTAPARPREAQLRAVRPGQRQRRGGGEPPRRARRG